MRERKRSWYFWRALGTCTAVFVLSVMAASTAIAQQLEAHDVSLIDDVEMSAETMPDQESMPDQQSIEQILAKQREDFLKEIGKDKAWQPTHEEAAVLEPVPDGGPDALHNFCLNADGNLLVCCGGDRVVYEPNPKSPMGADIKVVSEPGEIRVITPAGKRIATFNLDFTPQAIAIEEEGTIIVGGDGIMARLNRDGEVIKTVDFHAVKTGGVEAPEEKRDLLSENREAYLQSLLENGVAQEEAEKQADQIVKQMEESLENQRKMMIEASVNNGASQEEAEKAYDEMQKVQQEQTRRMRRQINGIAVTEGDIFVACMMSKGYGFAVWRLDLELKKPTQIIEGLRGCCGQMDIQAHDGFLYVAENARHRVHCYNRDGKRLRSFGKQDRRAADGFGGCCEPKNLRFSSADVLYTCQSGPPVVVQRFTPDGKFLGVAGLPSFTTGCVRVTVEVSKDRDQIFVLNSQENKIHMLKSNGKPLGMEPIVVETPRSQGVLSRVVESVGSILTPVAEVPVEQTTVEPVDAVDVPAEIVSPSKEDNPAGEIHSIETSSFDQPGPGSVKFKAIDRFQGKLGLNWKPVRLDAEHVSLTENPGTLTITTQRGSIHGDEKNDVAGDGIQAKNLFLIENPLGGGADFTIMLAVKDFQPETHYHQVGLICYDDDGNYMKWAYEQSWRKTGEQAFVMVRENEGSPQHDLMRNEPGLTRLWLRVTKRGDDYQCAYSADGKDFKVVGSRPWGNGPPKYLGFLAKNGGNPDAAKIDVQIDSFKITSP